MWFETSIHEAKTNLQLYLYICIVINKTPDHIWVFTDGQRESTPSVDAKTASTSIWFALKPGSGDDRAFRRLSHKHLSEFE